MLKIPKWLRSAVMSTLLVGHFSFFLPAQAAPLESKTILAVFAHPDDESFVGPVLARYAREGHKVYLVVVTDGQLGVTAHAGIAAGEPLKQARLAETQCATQALGIEAPIMLDFVDGSLAQSKTMQPVAAQLGQLFSQLKADVVITWGPEGGYGHPDHRMVSNLVAEVFQKGGDNWPQALYFAAAADIDLHNYNDYSANFGQYIKARWHTSAQQWLTHKIAFNQSDKQQAAAAVACHQSQFTAADIADINAFVGAKPWHVYLRQAYTQTALRQSLFE